MGILDWLGDPTLRPILLPGLLAAAAVVLCSSILSVLVVLKRLSFIGQGVSHSAFGGIGLAAALGLLSTAGAAHGGWSLTMVVVLAFCIAAAVAMAAIGDNLAIREDTAIGILLVASMSLGAVLLSTSVRRGATGGTGYESILFGQVLSVPVADALVAAGASLVSIAVLWFARRPLLLWAFDPTAAASLGVPVRAARLGLMILLAVAIVTAMRLVGVVLASALLVLPGATALRLSDRLPRVILLSCLAGLAGLLAGVGGAIRLDWPAGATIVLALTALFALASVWSTFRPRRPAPAPA